MSHQIRISAKTLAEVAMPDFCPDATGSSSTFRRSCPIRFSQGSSVRSTPTQSILCMAEFDRHHGPPAWLADLSDLAGYRIAAATTRSSGSLIQLLISC